MLPEPLHPAVVHFPIVLTTFLPLVALWALWRLRRPLTGRRSWLFPLGMAALLVVSAWTAVQTGEAQEDRVEGAVAERPFEAHEEAAELFLVLSGVTLFVMVLGLAPRRLGQAGRVAGTVAALALLVAGVRVGHSGGELAYRHGAAAAWSAADGNTTVQHGHDDGDDD